MASKVETLAPPPDWPKIITRSGSPPKVSILSRTHSRDWTRSSTPALPEPAQRSPAISARCMKPIGPRRWFTVTTTTSPRLAKWSPKYIGLLALPELKPPPWNQTITGRRALSSAGVHTLRLRQSSPIGPTSPPPVSLIKSSKRRVAAARSMLGASAPDKRSRGSMPCLERLPQVVQSLTPVHGPTGPGGRKRAAPPVGAP